MERIVVGVDGSEHSIRALRWAAGEARLRGAILEAVMVVPYSDVVGVPGAAFPVESYESVQKRAQARLQQILEEQLGEPTPGEVQPHAVLGPAAKELLDAAEGADLLVVGARGRGGFASLLLGSVSLQCALHAPCPVLIFRTSQDDRST
ncbi:MAG: universal stress protein [Nitriliruptorales bacterium]